MRAHNQSGSSGTRSGTGSVQDCTKRLEQQRDKLYGYTAVAALARDTVDNAENLSLHDTLDMLHSSLDSMIGPIDDVLTDLGNLAGSADKPATPACSDATDINATRLADSLSDSISGIRAQSSALRDLLCCYEDDHAGDVDEEQGERIVQLRCLADILHNLTKAAGKQAGEVVTALERGGTEVGHG